MGILKIIPDELNTKILLGLIYASLVLWIITVWALTALSHDERRKAFRMSHESAREADRYVAGQVVKTPAGDFILLLVNETLAKERKDQNG